jgi:hypothetical protein
MFGFVLKTSTLKICAALQQFVTSTRAYLFITLTDKCGKWNKFPSSDFTTKQVWYFAPPRSKGTFSSSGKYSWGAVKVQKRNIPFTPKERDKKVFK